MKLVEENSKITDKSLIVIEDDKIKINTDKEIVLKKCLLDELGFSNFFSVKFSPNFSVYKDLDKEQLIFKIDVPELNKNEIKAFATLENSNYRFQFFGEKKPDQNLVNTEKSTVLENKREHGVFSIDITIPTSEIILKNFVPNEKGYSEGVLLLGYQLSQQNTQPISLSFD